MVARGAPTDLELTDPPTAKRETPARACYCTSTSKPRQSMYFAIKISYKHRRCSCRGVFRGPTHHIPSIGDHGATCIFDAFL